MTSLTAMKLNEQIVKMRSVVEKVRVRLCRKLVRRHKVLEKSSNEKKKRKADRLLQEVNACKGMRREDVSKFALLNLKSLKDLNIRGSTPVQERVLYKLATEDLIVTCVSTFRKQYPEWHQEVPFLLQRLGMQYQAKKKDKIAEKERNENENSASSDEESDAAEVKQKDEKAIMKDKIKELVKKNVQTVAKKEKALNKKKKKGLPEGRNVKPLISLPKPIIASTTLSTGQGVIQQLVLDGSNTVDNDHSTESAQSSTSHNRRNDAYKATVEDERYVLDIGGSEEESEKDLSLKRKRMKASGTKTPKSLPKSAKVPEPTEKIHPSWAAKKRQAELIEKLKHTAGGKRKVFDED